MAPALPLQGLDWLVKLHDNGTSGILAGVVHARARVVAQAVLLCLTARSRPCSLADEMGLGKTVQIIAFICHSTCPVAVACAIAECWRAVPLCH